MLDNNGKDLDNVRPVVDWAKSASVKQFLYISSAGIYKKTNEPPHVEGQPWALTQKRIRDNLKDDVASPEVPSFLGFVSWKMVDSIRFNECIIDAATRSLILSKESIAE
ncbi:hypothetical protein IFM89_020833 [Coptis chinensis]|uniref:Uncharacterized protein n=1 Tax=Coptis chinensis TaxID=261450 RepID=A0A835IZR2_9MAGN|nr:hypothetical protein IFM89_020833 [Coptis chinensis]